MGAFVPGGIIALLISGLLVKLGYFVFWKVVLVAMAASVLIDLFGYGFGRSRNKKILYRRARIFFVKNKTIERVVRVVHGHTGKSLIIGKINPVTRSIAPFIFGNERISFWKFLFFSVLGSFLWVGSFVFLGYILGNSYETIVAAEKDILWGGFIILGLFYAYYLGNLFKEFFGKRRVKNGNNSKK